jgi:hypothetical protein
VWDDEEAVKGYYSLLSSTLHQTISHCLMRDVQGDDDDDEASG